MEAIKVFAVCEACNNVVYREPGERHGDGQQDTDAAPVWLLGSSDMLGNTDRKSLPTVNCGCSN